MTGSTGVGTVEGRDDGEKAVLIPSKTMHELSRILGMGWEGDLELHLSENLALFSLGENGEVEIITHLLDTPYPDYEKVYHVRVKSAGFYCVSI